jgi:hypothetical protein
MILPMTFRHLALFAVLLARAAGAAAQDRPFVFSVTTASEVSKPQVNVAYDIGIGEPAFHGNDDANAPEQRFVVQASLGRWTLIGHAGLTHSGGATTGSQQGELLYSVLQQRTSGVALAVGGGVLHEAGGVNVLLGRVAAGRDFDAWRLHANALFQKPMSSERDTVDLITSVGWARRLTPSLSLGVEGIGEDLEGFWEPDEAEGGARLLVGPSVHVAPPGSRWQLSVAGGPMFHPNDTGRSSQAFRDLPASTRRIGYALRTSFAYGF